MISAKRWPAPTMLVCLCISFPAHALTTPAPGAAAKPAGLTLVAPFPCGVTYKVVAGYGGAYHKNINEPQKSNDHHALDMVRDEKGSGHDKPLVAAAAGTVKYAGWAKQGWSTYGNIVLIELDFKDGHTYHVHYAHLEKVLVKVGQHVKARDVVGHLGKSGDNSLTYWQHSHLHFVFYRDAKIGSGGPYGGVAAVPEPMDGVEDFVTGTKATVSCAPKPDTGPAPPKDSGPTGDASVASDGASSVDSGTPADRGTVPPPADWSGGGDEGCSCAVYAGGHGSMAFLPLLLLLLSLILILRRRRYWLGRSQYP